MKHPNHGQSVSHRFEMSGPYRSRLHSQRIRRLAIAAVILGKLLVAAVIFGALLVAAPHIASLLDRLLSWGITP